MVMIADRTLVRESARPEVWWIEGGVRRWVPDSQTVDSLGGWQAVQLLAYGGTIDNPLGPMYPSAGRPYAWDDGSLIAAWPNPRVYVMHGGYRIWITSPQVFVERGYDWNHIQPISSSEMNAIPEGPPDYGSGGGGGVPPELIINTGRVFLGSGHYMETNAKFTRANGVTAGGTTTETVTWFGGYHGGVYAILSDVNDIPVPGGQSPLWRYGVDGSMIGTSKRTDAWSFSIDLAQAPNVHNLTIFHIWAPNQFQVILNQWVQAGQSVGQLAQAVGAVASVVAAL